MEEYVLTIFKMIREGNIKSLKLILLMLALGVPLMGDNCDDREVKEEQKEVNCAALTNESDCNKTANRCEWKTTYEAAVLEKCIGTPTRCPIYSSNVNPTSDDIEACMSAGCAKIQNSDNPFSIRYNCKVLYSSDIKKCPSRPLSWITQKNCESIGCSYVPSKAEVRSEKCIDNF
jgi:hypothetical protein